MAERDNRLGAYSQFSTEAVERFGMAYCLRKTIEHLEAGRDQPPAKGKEREMRASEVQRLRRMIPMYPDRVSNE